MNTGFTLLEMLVVVLIMGILASIALPQYQRAVLKSKFVGLMPGASALRDAEEAYYLLHRHYTNDPQELDIRVQGNNVEIVIDNTNGSYVSSQRPDLNNRVVMYLDHSAISPGEIHCEALATDQQANWVCSRGMGGRAVEGSGTYKAYRLEGN